MKINGKEVNHKMFAYDGCHKIYLLDNDEQKEEVLKNEYEVLPIELIEEIYLDSCELRFIYVYGTFESIVGQFEKAVFEY